jgi:hypothetical protein
LKTTNQAIAKTANNPVKATGPDGPVALPCTWGIRRGAVSFAIEHAGGDRDSFGNYKYRILENGRLIAHYWHDYRGDEHGIDFVNGTSELWPVGRMIEFVEGGGPKPLTLSEKAVAYLNGKLGR